MSVPVQITFKGLDASPSISEKIEAKAEKLERFSSRIQRCHVTVAQPHQHHSSGKLFDIRIDLTVPGKEIVVHRGNADPSHTDVEIAIRDAFDAATRQLEDYTSKQNEHR